MLASMAYLGCRRTKTSAAIAARACNRGKDRAQSGPLQLPLRRTLAVHVWRRRRTLQHNLSIRSPRNPRVPIIFTTTLAVARTPGADQERDNVAPVDDRCRDVGGVVEDRIVGHQRTDSA